MATITTEEFNKVYNEYYRRVFSLVYKILKDHDRTNDVVQNTFLKLLKQDYDSVSDHLFSWLCVVARNDSFKVGKKEKIYVTLLETDLDKRVDDFNGLDNVLMKERIKELNSAMKHLSKNQRDVIMNRFYHDLSYRDSGKKLNLSETNVGFILNKAINKLRTKMSA